MKPKTRVRQVLVPEATSPPGTLGTSFCVAKITIHEAWSAAHGWLDDSRVSPSRAREVVLEEVSRHELAAIVSDFACALAETGEKE